MTTARMAALSLCLTLWLSAQPGLTTIQDVLYKADGTKFNGVATITWTSFEASDTSNIPSQNVTAKIVDGILRVRLVPTTTANPLSYYSVTYNSDGKVQFQETWVVPPSQANLRIRDVRSSVSPLQPSSQTPLQESDVLGLVGDLSLRPVKGPGYGVGRAAVVNALGGIDTVSGDPADCVRVDGTSGPCSAAAFVDGEVPGGIVDGANAAFSLNNAPNPTASLALYRNGLLQKAGFDFTLSSSTVTFLTGAIPQPADTLLVSYRIGGGGTIQGSQSAFPAAQVICSSAGSASSATVFVSLGTCTIPQGVLQTGDRLEIRFDLAHMGTTAAFEFEVLWGATALVDRSAAAGDALIAGRGEAGLFGGATQLSVESWGTVLVFAANSVTATDSILNALTIDFRSKMLAATTETVALRNFGVVRYPAVSNP